MLGEWGRHHEEVLRCIRQKVPQKILVVAINKLQHPNAFQEYSNGTFSLLFHAVMNYNKEAFELLLDRGADPTVANNKGTTVLDLLMKRNLVDWADICVKNMTAEQKAKFVNNSKNGKNGWSVLMAAAENGWYPACEWLVKNLASVNSIMQTRWTALHAAAKMGHTHIVKLLLEAGGDPNIEATHREFGNNLTVADVTTDPEIMELLRQHGYAKE